MLGKQGVTLRNAGLISKLSPSTVGYTTIARGSSLEGIAYSLIFNWRK